MTWVRLEDSFHSHPKLHLAGRRANVAAGVYVRALSYCGSGLTDGFVDGHWVKQIATKSERELVEKCGLWKTVTKGFAVEVSGRKDSGRRHLPDVIVVMPANGYYISDYLHFNPSREEVLERRKRRATESADESASDAQLSAQLSAHTPDPTPTHEEHKGLLRGLPASRPGPVERLAEVMRDFNGRQPVRVYLNALAAELKLSEGDFEYARELALGPGVDSPSAIAIDALKKRAGVAA